MPSRLGDARAFDKRLAGDETRGGERLQLHFDVAAEMTTRVGDNLYEVRMSMPYVKEKR